MEYIVKKFVLLSTSSYKTPILGQQEEGYIEEFPEDRDKPTTKDKREGIS